MLTCKRLRTAVLLSAILLVAGLVLETLAQTVTFTAPTDNLALLSAFSAFSVFSALGVLAVTFLASLLPGNAARLNECQH